MEVGKIIEADSLKGLSDIRVGMSFEGPTKEEVSELDVSFSFNDNQYNFYYEEVIPYSGYKKQVWLGDAELSELESDIEDKFADDHEKIMNEVKKAITRSAYMISVDQWSAGSEVVQVAYDNEVAVMPSPGELYRSRSWEEVEVMVRFGGEEYNFYLEGEMYDADDALGQAKESYDALREEHGITDYEWNSDLSEQFTQIWNYSANGYSMTPGNGLREQTGEDFVQGFN